MAVGRGYISQAAQRAGLDPRAVLAVASQEGLGGGIGEQGTSFGPFQLHYGGAYPGFAPRGQAASQAWAWSPAGINYALRQMGSARGLQGQPAVNAIVRNFERPADPAGEAARAWASYSGGRFPTGPPAGAVPTPPARAQAAPGRVYGGGVAGVHQPAPQPGSRVKNVSLHLPDFASQLGSGIGNAMGGMGMGMPQMQMPQQSYVDPNSMTGYMGGMGYGGYQGSPYGYAPQDISSLYPSYSPAQGYGMSPSFNYGAGGYGGMSPYGAMGSYGATPYGYASSGYGGGPMYAGLY